MTFQSQTETTDYLATAGELVSSHLHFWRRSGLPESAERIAALLQAREAIDQQDATGYDAVIVTYARAILRDDLPRRP